MVYRKNKAIALGIILAIMPSWAYGQSPTEMQIPCVSPNTIIRAEQTPVMADAEGRIWFKIRFIDTGKTLLGFFTKRNNNFCIIAEGKTNPET